jgi:hypothetical protein
MESGLATSSSMYKASKCAWVSSLTTTKLFNIDPSSRLISLIVFFYLLSLAYLWKNEVFLSLDFNQRPLDLSFHSSSLFR